MRSYRVVFESYEGKNKVKRIVLTEGEVEKPKDVFNLGFSHKEQVNLIGKTQKELINEQKELFIGDKDCPNCRNKLVKNGERESQYHDVFSDHKLKIPRYRCKKYKYET